MMLFFLPCAYYYDWFQPFRNSCHVGAVLNFYSLQPSRFIFCPRPIRPMSDPCPIHVRLRFGYCSAALRLRLGSIGAEQEPNKSRISAVRGAFMPGWRIGAVVDGMFLGHFLRGIAFFRGRD